MTLLTQRLSSHPQPYTGFGVVGTTREVEVQRVAALVAEADRQWMARRVSTGRLTTPLTMNQMIQIKWTAIRSYEVGCYAHLGCDHLALALSPRAGGHPASAGASLPMGGVFIMASSTLYQGVDAGYGYPTSRFR